MWFGILLRAAAVTAMLVTLATHPSSSMTAPRQLDVAVSVAAEPAPLRFVSIRRPPPLATCAELADRGPSIDAIQIRRAGVVISAGVAPYISSARCTADGLVSNASSTLAGTPDGVGVALAGNEYAWSLSDRLALRPGDEVVVTLLAPTGEPFQVFAGSDPLNHELPL